MTRKRVTAPQQQKRFRDKIAKVRDEWHLDTNNTAHPIKRRTLELIMALACFRIR
jgi:hypothetical protein